MSIVEKIGLLPVLEQLGLTEDQFRGILKGENDKLMKQERILNEQIQTHAAKINELTELRSKANQANEQEKLEIEAEKKKLLELRVSIQQERGIAEKEKQEVLILRQKLNDDKAQFQKDREIITRNGEKLTSDIKREKELLAELESKSKALDVEKDDLYISQARVKEESKKLLAGIDSFEIEKTKLVGEKAKFNSEKESFQESVNKLELSAKNTIQKYEEKLDDINSDKKAFEAEKIASLESLRQRELVLARKEKEIDAIHNSLERKKEDAEISEAKPVETHHKKVKKAK